MDGADVVAVEVDVGAHPADVYRYWTDPERYARWMGRFARLDPTPGGEYFVEMSDGFAAMGTFLELDPPDHLTFTWGWAPGAGEAVLTGPQRDEILPPGASRVRVVLHGHGDRTSVRLEHHDLPAQILRDDHALAWRTYLARLVVVVEGGDPGPDPHARAT